MLNGLDLFSGIGGIALALSPWVRPIAYCEIDRYAQAVLASRMAGGDIPLAPIWDDVQSLKLPATIGIDIITAGFPCQDISVAGLGKGLAGERSGLFWEIHRLCRELEPRFIFLENVPAITTRGGTEVVRAITALGYDCRWLTLSAAAVGANHKRERWWLLAYAKGKRYIQRGETGNIFKAHGRPDRSVCPELSCSSKQSKNMANTVCERLEGQREIPIRIKQEHPFFTGASWWAIEPNVGRVAYGVPHRVDRIKGLGNAVVPLQARTAFQILSGLT